MASQEEAQKVADKLAEEFLGDLLEMTEVEFAKKYLYGSGNELEITTFSDSIQLLNARIPLMRLAYNGWFNSKTEEIEVYDLTFHIKASAKIHHDAVLDIMDTLNEQIEGIMLNIAHRAVYDCDYDEDSAVSNYFDDLMDDIMHDMGPDSDE